MDINEMLEKYQKGNQRVNYDHILKEVVKTWTHKPKVLMHSCCAPCSTVMLEEMSKVADVSVYFSNSNIYPRSEYQRRALVQKKFIDDFNEANQTHVGFIEAPYKPNEFVKMVKEGKLEHEPEGGKRCTACFDMRLDSVAKKAQELGFDYFGSALTLSPHKNSQVINNVGFEVQKLYTTKYLPSDFKKNNGYKRSIEMCHQFDVYRQCYCGCIFAAKDQKIDLKKINEEAKAFLQES